MYVITQYVLLILNTIRFLDLAIFVSDYFTIVSPFNHSNKVVVCRMVAVEEACHYAEDNALLCWI